MASPELQEQVRRKIHTKMNLLHTRVLSPIRLSISGRMRPVRLRQTSEVADTKSSPQEKHLLELMPDAMAQGILSHGIVFTTDSQQSKTVGNVVQIAYTHDFFHELGHTWWQHVMLNDAQRAAIKATLIREDSERVPLNPNEIPAPHAEYARLVNAHTGQFIFNQSNRGRHNDLEEHFARNVQNLILCRPLEVTAGDEESEEKLLQFFLKHSIIDEQHAALYRAVNQKVLRLTRNVEEVKRADQVNKVNHEEIYALLQKVRQKR